MKSDELAFVNQQLAGMLKSGLPLEGALRQICSEMRRGALRDELRALEADLGRGTPFRDALAARRLPAFYTAMLQVGAASNDLPGVLTLLADYYQRAHLTWTRLKGLLVYPLIVLGAALAVSVIVAAIYQRIAQEMFGDLSQGGMAGQSGLPSSMALAVNLWSPVVIIALLFGAAVLMLLVPTWRRELRWRAPGFKEAGLSHLASALALMLEKGCTLDQALTLLQQLEAGSPAWAELGQWRARLAAGHKKFPELTSGGNVVPPLFVWLVAGSGEDWVAGFKQAAAVYYERAKHRVEMLLYAALPVSVLALGFLILTQVMPDGAAVRGLHARDDERDGSRGMKVTAMDPFEELIQKWLLVVVYTFLGAAPLAFIGLGWQWLSSTLAREERARSFLDLLSIGLRQGHTPEQAVLALAGAGVADFGSDFQPLARAVQSGQRLSAALESVPKFLPPPVRAMLRVGEELGDLRPVLPAAQAVPTHATSAAQSITNNLVLVIFVSPIGPVVLAILAVWVFPKLKMIASDMAPDGSAWSPALFEGSIMVAWLIGGLWAALVLGDTLRRTLRVFGSGLPDRVEFLMPWRRRRMERDFSTMLALLLDAGVPEARALRMSADCAANASFRARVERAVGELERGAKLPDAVQPIGHAGEFGWRLRNAAAPGRGFAAALAGWHEALAAKAFQQQQAISQIVTTSFVFLNGAMVGLAAFGMFELLLAVLEEAAL